MILLHTINRLRGDYHAWLQYITDKPDNYKRYESDEERTAKKAEWLKIVCAKFPDAKLMEKREEMISNQREARKAHEKLNGTLIREWTGLEGKDLGNAISQFKATFGTPEAYNVWLQKVTPEDAKKTFMDTQPSVEM